MPIYLNHSSPHEEQNNFDEIGTGKIKGKKKKRK